MFVSSDPLLQAKQDLVQRHSMHQGDVYSESILVIPHIQGRDQFKSSIEQLEADVAALRQHVLALRAEHDARAHALSALQHVTPPPAT